MRAYTIIMMLAILAASAGGLFYGGAFLNLPMWIRLSIGLGLICFVGTYSYFAQKDRNSDG